MKIKHLKKVDSTNLYIKRYLDTGRDTIVTADIQTGGMGTKGRSFSSQKGGVYLTALTFYRDFPASEAFRIMAHAAVAVCRTAETFGAEPQIKWANDVYIGRRKITGILIENIFEGGNIRASIVGIGVNVYNDLAALNGIATSLLEETGKKFSVRRVRKELIKNLRKGDTLSDYLSYVHFLGTTVRVTEGEREYLAIAEEILPDGRLKVNEGGKTRILSAAEISLKLEEGGEVL